MANIKRANTSGITKPGTAIADVPDAPTIGTATGGQAAATVTYTAAATGGTATTFTATSTPGSVTGTGASPIIISGLTNGTAYSFTVTASNSTGTSPASSASNQITPVSLGDMDPIAMVEVGSAGASTVSFSSIPDTYTHLQIRGIARSNASSDTDDVLVLRFNGDTGANYAWHRLRGDGASATSVGFANEIAAHGGYVAGNSGGSFGTVVLDILDYASISKYKTFRSFSGADNNGSGRINLTSSVWMSATKITSIVFGPAYGTAYNQYSSFALYGIK